MEPASLFDPQRSIWKVLPLRPQPEPLESITGYITRLAEANGLQSINELGALAGGMIFYIRHAFWRTSPDYPAPPYPGLAQLTGYPEEQWLGMTFFYLVQYFGRSTHPRPLHKFLAGSLVTSFVFS